MNKSNFAPNGMVVTPHHLATQSALKILRDGGTAMEAMVAAAATISVVYPHATGIGGDGFWLIIPPQGDPVVIEACGPAGEKVNLDYFGNLSEIPKTGPKSAITVAGVVGGWNEALKYASECGYGKFSLSQLLCDAISYAEDGFPVTTGQEESLHKFLSKKPCYSEEFKNIYLPNGKVPKTGERFYQKQLANTLKELSSNGLNSFYEGKVAKTIEEDMRKLGMIINETDLNNYSPMRRIPLRLVHKNGEILNLPPPTQGLLSLSILGVLDKLNITGHDEGEFIHVIVEATKRAFEIRDKYLTDPKYMKIDVESLWTPDLISTMASQINFNYASGVGQETCSGDTVWMGIMDSKGYSISYIQSIYRIFGSGMLLPKTGILWQNRGISFNLHKDHIRCVMPGKKPFHTLNPAAAFLKDGRVMVYGTQGGDGQSQTQAAIFHRYVVQGINLQQSISKPRWLFESTTLESDATLSIEDGFEEEIYKYLKERGHRIVKIPLYDSIVGESGALVRHPNGMMEGAHDPRSCGSAAGY